MNVRRERAIGFALAMLSVLVAPSAWAQRRPPPARQARQAPPAPGASSAGTRAPEACIDEARAQALLACPASAVRIGSNGGTALPVNVRNAPPEHNAAPVNAPPAPPPPVNPGQVLRQQQIQGLVIANAQQSVTLLRQLARTTPMSDPHRPDVLLRLAETLDDLARMANGNARALDEPIHAAQVANDRVRLEQRTRAQAQFTAEARQSRADMVVVLQALAHDHPAYARAEYVLFLLGFSLEEQGNAGEARRVFLTLIQRFPQSQYVPYAYVSFADHFFDAREFESARQFYERVVAIQAPTNTLAAYAQYRLAWTFMNLTQYDQALDAFFRVIDYGRQHPENASAEPLMRAARGELVSAYGAVHGVSRPLRPGEAYNTFRRYAADDAGASAMLEHLGELYQDRGQWPNAIAVYHELMSEQPGAERLCVWQSQVTRAVVASRPRPEQMTEVTRLLDLHARYRAPGGALSSTAREQCRDAAARVVFDVASHWHLEVIGRAATGQQQTTGTRDPVTMARVAQLYQALLDHFPDLDQVRFPEYDEHDWPTRYRVAYYRADILRDRGDHCACGAAYDAVVDMDPQGAFTEDAAYKAVLCYNDCAAGRPVARPTTAPGAADPRSEAALHARDLSADEAAMDRAFRRYVCFASAAPASAQGAAPGGAQGVATTLLTIRYRRAYLRYAANHFEEAAALFREVAFSDPTVQDPENLREIAADLYFDSLNVMATRWSPPRAACLRTMSAGLERASQAFCAPAQRAAHADFCDRSDNVLCDVMRREADELRAQRRFLEAARLVLRIVREHSRYPHIDELLYQAASDLDAAGMLGRAMRVREVLVQRFLPLNSTWAQRALYRLGQNYHAIQVFSRAAELYEQYAAYVNAHRDEAQRADAHAVDQAADALRQATIFRIGLGDETRALADAESFARYFGADPSRRALAASVVFSIGQVYQDRAARLSSEAGGTAQERARREAQVRATWRDVVRHYTAYVQRYARNGTLDQQIQGDVALGRAYVHLGDETRAQLYFRAAIGLWGEAPRAAAGAEASARRTEGEARIREQLGAQGADEGVDRARQSVAEARFTIADLLYQRFTRRHLPEFRGAQTVRAFRDWEERTLRPYVAEQNRQLREQATPQFEAVMAMRVPNWQIAAAERLADMFYQLARLIQDAPVPPDVLANPDLEAEYIQVRQRYVSQYMGVAREGFEGCIRVATTVHWYNDWSRLCEQALNRIDPRAFPLADEVRTLPELVFSRPADGRPVYQVDATGDVEP